MHIVNNTKNALQGRVACLILLDVLCIASCLKTNFSVLKFFELMEMTLFANLLLLFDYARASREYDIDESGITAIWLGKMRKSYKWEEFVDIHSYVALARYSQDELLLCSTIPVKEREPGVVLRDWVSEHPFQVLYFDQLTPQEKERFYAFVPRFILDKQHDPTHTV